MPENIFWFYESLVDTKSFNLIEEIAESMEEHGAIAYMNEEEGWGRSVTKAEYFKFRAKEEGKSIFKHLRALILNEPHEEKFKLYNKYVTQITTMVSYLRKQSFLQDDRESFANELELVIEQLRDRFDFDNTQPEETTNNLTQPQIKWLGKTNVLATLIFDLWQGQEKIKNPRTNKLISAQKKDLVKLLLNNFVDENGEPFKASTIDTYLNTSREDSRAGIGDRIEIETP